MFDFENLNVNHLQPVNRTQSRKLNQHFQVEVEKIQIYNEKKKQIEIQKDNTN